jgi:hypothetical protein
MRYAPGAVINLITVTKGYDAVVKTTDASDFYPVEAFAVILDRYDEDEQMVTHIEAVIRIDDRLLTVTEVQAEYGKDSIFRYTK